MEAAMAAELGLTPEELEVYLDAQAGQAPPAAAPPWPTRRELKAWALFGGPLCLGQAARVANVCVVQMSASASGAVGGASHQIIMGIFCLLATAGDAVSQTAQTYLPALPDTARLRPARVALRRRLLLLGLGTGVLAAIGSVLPLAAPRLAALFCADGAVQAGILRLLPSLSACLFCYSFGSSLEGLLVAGRDHAFVGRLYAAAPFVTLAFMRALRGCAGCADGAVAAWTAYASFFAVRVAVFGGRALRRSPVAADAN
eukprot:Transcript_25259.p1 GENE.Transcript_25259~~Transcript_25259.p1  ORF type:complete len:258 (+),score=121.13 Transcript_25259:1511-2284(+)